jgi:hypothetical protein
VTSSISRPEPPLISGPNFLSISEADLLSSRARPPLHLQPDLSLRQANLLHLPESDLLSISKPDLLSRLLKP